MAYKVFLVEDEIITREGIRDNVDWKAAGFEFCGEAPDGEIALPLIDASKPDVLITDIKMPFMDGLQLSKIIHEHMPWIKIVILSGHDEFHFAQSAIQLGVTEYLLKPVSSLDLNRVLQRLYATLEQEKQERENLIRLQNKFRDTLVLSRDHFLLRLVMGGVSSAEAVEQSQQLGLQLLARCYLVILIQIELCESAQPFDYQEYQQVEHIVSRMAGNTPDVFLIHKDMEELVLLVKGDSPEQLQMDGSFLTSQIKEEVESLTSCRLAIDIGSVQHRLGDIHHSFADALVKLKGNFEGTLLLGLPGTTDQGFLKLDHRAIEDYVKFGSLQDFDSFFVASLQPIAEASLRSYTVKHFMFVDLILTVSQLIREMGGEIDQILPQVHEIENGLTHLKSIEQIKDQMGKIFLAVLDFRNSRTYPERSIMIRQAKAYVDQRLADADLRMSLVADLVHLSPGHFSTVFHQEMGESFQEYLGRARMNRAKELLCTTHLKCAEVAYQSGYNDPHYFSAVFKKKIGLTPQQFRARFRDQKQSYPHEQ